MTRFIYCAFILTFGIALQSSGQHSSLNLDDIVNTSIENSYQIKQSFNDYQLSKQERLSAFYDFFPDLNAELTGDYLYGPQRDRTTGEIGIFGNKKLDFEVAGELTIFNAFRNQRNYRYYIHREKSVSYHHKRLINSVAIDAVQYYLQYLISLELEKILEENVNYQQDQLDLIQTEFELGSRTETDVFNQESLIAASETDLIRRKNQTSFNKLILLSHLNLNPFDGYSIEPLHETYTDYHLPTLNLDDLIASAITNRLDLRSLNEDLIANEYRYQAAKSALFPSVSFQSSFSTEYSERNSFSFNDQAFKNNIEGIFSFNVRVPIFSNKDESTNTQSKFISLKNSELEFINAEMEAIQEVTEAYNELNSVIAELNSVHKAHLAAEQAYRMEEQRFRMGSSTLLQLNEANKNKLEQQSLLTEKKYLFAYHKFALLFATGNFDSSNVTNLVYQF